MWCWPQELGQPLMCTRILRVSGSSIASSAEPLLDCSVEPHRGGDPELAGVGAGAGDHVFDLLRVGRAELQLAERLPDGVDALVGNPAQHQVLLRGRAGAVAAVAAQDLRHAVELRRRDVALRDADFDRRVARLALRRHVGRGKTLELRAVAVRLHRDRRQRPLVGRFVVVIEQLVDRRVVLGPRLLQLSRHHLLERRLADPVDEELEPRLEDVLAQLVGRVEESGSPPPRAAGTR